MVHNLIRSLCIIERRVWELERAADNLSKATAKELAEEDFTITGDFVRYLYGLPEALSEILVSLERLGETTASAVAEDSGRSVSLERARLNRLFCLGYVQKTRKGRFVYFRLFGLTDRKRLTAKDQEGTQIALTSSLPE